MSPQLAIGEVSLDRMVSAVDGVRKRLELTAATLDNAGVPYAVIGGNAVAAWVSRIDAGAVRNTKDVDILLRRDDMPAAMAAMTAAGFTFRHSFGVDMFVDHPDARSSDAVHVLYARERVKPGDPMPLPDVDDSERSGGLNVISLVALVRMKLMSYRLRDQTHLVDLARLGMIDASWMSRVPAELVDRLVAILNQPDVIDPLG